MTEPDLLRWRAEFPLLGEKIHVANCSQTPQSRRVKRAIDHYLDNWREAGVAWDSWLREVSAAKKEFARLINAEAEEIAITTSASAAAASVASALDFTAGRNRIVTTEAEFPSVALVWLAHRKYGLQVDQIPLRNGRIELDDYAKLIDHRTVLTSASHVCYRNGFKQNLSAIAEIVHARGSLLLVDAYQSLGTCRLDVKQADIDFLISGNLKYLLGIPGIAFLYVKQQLVRQLQPAITGWFGQKNPFAFDSKKLDFAPGASRFDTGTPPIIAAYAARAGMQIINQIGVENIETRIDHLSSFAINRALQLGLDYVGPDDIAAKGATTAIRVADARRIQSCLAERNIIASARGDIIRIAPHFFTREEELDAVLGELQSICAPH